MQSPSKVYKIKNFLIDINSPEFKEVLVKIKQLLTDDALTIDEKYYVTKHYMNEYYTNRDADKSKKK